MRVIRTWASSDRRTFLSFYSGRVGLLRLVRSADFSAWSLQLARERFGLVFPSARPVFGGSAEIWVMPVWIALLALLVPTTIAWIKCRRYPPGRCQSCGYDLTGNVSGTCPECGTAVDADAAAKDVTRQD